MGQKCGSSAKTEIDSVPMEDQNVKREAGRKGLSNVPSSNSSKGGRESVALQCEELTVYFIRHGQSTWNAAKVKGVTAQYEKLSIPDQPLSALGIKQSLVNGFRACHVPADEVTSGLQDRMRIAFTDPRVPILTSNLHRAIQTAMLYLLPYKLKYPACFPRERTLRVLSMLQEISSGYDASPDCDHDEESIVHPQNTPE